MTKSSQLRPGINAPDEVARDRLVRRIAKMRAEAVLNKNTWEHWNRMHPDEPQLDTSFEDGIIAWCDGRGPLPPEASP